MLSSVEPWDMVAEGYANTSMKFFLGYVEEALKLAKLSRKHRILDVACGPGTLALQAAKLAGSVHAIDFSEAMIAILQKTIVESNLANISAECADGQ